MRVAGDAVLHAPVEKVWSALLDPSVLVATLPGCERLELTGENSYDMTITAGVASIKDTYTGTVELTDLVEPSSLVLTVAGSGASGTVAATVNVAFSDNADGTTGLRYDADATVGGMIGGVGQRMLSSVSKRMAGEFFGNVERAITQPEGEEGGATVSKPEVSPSGAQVFTAPPRAARGLDEQSFLKGVAVGAGLVLLGVLAGRLSARG